MSTTGTAKRMRQGSLPSHRFTLARNETFLRPTT
jgi:hypothetical protein